jgi:hypothetical protein
MHFPTMQAGMCLDSWFTADLVPVEEVVKYFKQLNSRRKVKNLKQDDDSDTDVEISESDNEDNDKED